MTSSSKKSAPSNFNLPNAITALRIALAPVVFLVTLTAESPTDRWWAAGLFLLVISTDGIDGYIARSRGLVTDLGKILDPIADKLVTSGTLIVLSLLNELPWAVTATIIIREVGITIWRMWALGRGKVVPASGGGKLKTVMQAVAITAALTPLGIIVPWWNIVNTVLMSAALVLTVWSGLQYLREAARLT